MCQLVKYLSNFNTISSKVPTDKNTTLKYHLLNSPQGSSQWNLNTFQLLISEVCQRAQAGLVKDVT